MTKPSTADAYLAALPAAQRAALERLRAQIAAAAPEAEECISYGLPAFRQGKLLVGYGATKKHCALYLMSGRVAEGFAEELADFDTSKGTVRFQPATPLPADLVARLVAARLAENAG